MTDGYQIKWNFKNSVLYTLVTIVCFAIVIGWFKLSVALMGLAG